METKELKIQIPKGYEIDKEKSTFEKIVFKEKENTKPRSWKEYLELNTGFDGCGINWNMDGGVQTTGLHHRGKAIVPTKYGAPFIAMMQLMSLRQAWIGDWEPDWNASSTKYGILNEMNNIMIGLYYSTSKPLSFPTKEMAEDFMNCFRDLLDIAKPLI